MPVSLQHLNEDLLKQLSAEFPVEEVKQRKGKGNITLDYISIDSTINRFNEVLGAAWSVHPFETKVTFDLEGNVGTAVVTIELTALGKTATGIGSGKSKDVDDAVKIALAEAIKKAGHQFGVGLYLWDEEKREEIAESRKEQKKEPSF